MTITINSLGTNNAKGATLCDFSYADGLVASAGDFIVVGAAMDTPYLQSGTYFLSYTRNKAIYPNYVYTQNNSGNVTSYIFVWHIPEDTVSGDLIRINGGASNNATAVSVYQVTNLNYAVNWADPTTPASSSTLQVSPTWYGNMTYFQSCTITSMSAYLHPYAAPSNPVGGSLVARVYDLSGSVVGTFDTVDVSTLTPGSYGWVDFSSSSVEIGLPGHYFVGVTWESKTSGSITIYQDNTYTVSVEAQNASYNSSTNVITWSYSTPRSFKLPGAVTSAVDQDTENGATGTDAPYNTGSTGTLSQSDELVLAVISIEEQTDNLGSWTTGSGYVSGNEQSDGTTGGGGASNVAVATAAVITSATTSLQGDMNASSPDWAATIASWRHGIAVASKTGSVSAYMEGYQYPADDNISAFMEAVGDADPAVTMIVYWLPTPAGTDASDSIYAFAAGKDTDTDFIHAYLSGVAGGTQTSYKFAYLRGKMSDLDSVEAYLAGLDNTDSSIYAYTAGWATATSSVFAYIVSGTDLSDNISAFLEGGYNRGSITAYLEGIDYNPTSSIHAFTNGLGVFPFSDDFNDDDYDPWNGVKWSTQEYG